MNDVDELKQFAVAHARAQNIPRYREVLAAISTDDADTAGSWVGEWTRAGDRLRSGGHAVDAVRCYNMARFPYVNGPARQEALDRCVETFGGWAGQNGIDRLDLDLSVGPVGCWSTGLSTTKRLPLVLICGGIVSIKEQWAPALALVRRFGMAGIVMEMPGVGENAARYDEGSPQLIGELLDAVADRAEVARTTALMLSFSGHLGLRRAVEDPRIRGLITAGPPVGPYFTDAAWHAALPAVTRDTLAQLTGAKPEELFDLMRPWALTPEQLAALDIPVACTASARDEIIPAGDVRMLRDHVRDLDLVEIDDVHGSPRHTAESRVWAARSILRMNDVRNAQSAVLGLVLGALRARRRLVPA